MRITARLGGLSLVGGLLMLVMATAPSARAAGSTSGTPWLGVYTQELSPDLRDGLDYRGDGVLVTRVIPGSPADRAGVEKGDVIVRVDSRAVTTPENLASAVRANRAGESVVLQVVRDGARRSINAKLEARPVDDDSDQPESPGDRDDSGDMPTPHSGDDHDFSFDMPGDGMAMLQMMGHGRLGVRVADLDQDLGSYFGIKDGQGVLVLEVVKDTPAARAGIKAGDVITRVDDHSVSSSSELIRALATQDEGKVSLSVMRHGARQTIEAELAKGDGPRVMRMRRGDGMMGWRDDGSMRRSTSSDDQDLRQQLLDLKNELKDLRKQLDEMKHD